MFKVKYQLQKYWPILIVAFFMLFLRLYKLEELAYFSYDEAIPAFVGKRLFEVGHVPLVGGVTPFGFHMAPYFYWLSALILFIGKNNPLIWGVASAAISILTTLLFFIVGREIFNRKVAFLAATIWAFSYLAIVFDKHFWALYWGPIIALLTLYSLIKIIKKEYKFFYLLGIVLAFAIHADLSNLIFLSLIPLAIFIYKIPIKKEAFIAAFVIAASFFPLIVFDLRHNFANSKPLVNYFTQNQKQANNPQGFLLNTIYFGRTATRTLYPFADNQFAKNYTYCTNHIIGRDSSVPLIFSLASLIAIFSYIYWKGRKNEPLLITLIFSLYFIGIHAFGTLFASDVFEHYLSGLIPIYIFIFAWIFTKLPKWISIILLIVFITLNLYRLSETQNSFGLTQKRQAVEYVQKELGASEFSLESLSTCWKYSGYRYLFAALGKEPVKSYVDPNLSHLYGTTRVADTHPNIVVAFVTHDFTLESDKFYLKYANYKSHETKSKLFGNIEVIIMDNSNHWFDKYNTNLGEN